MQRSKYTYTYKNGNKLDTYARQLDIFQIIFL